MLKKKYKDKIYIKQIHIILWGLRILAIANLNGIFILNWRALRWWWWGVVISTRHHRGLLSSTILYYLLNYHSIWLFFLYQMKYCLKLVICYTSVLIHLSFKNILNSIFQKRIRKCFAILRNNLKILCKYQFHLNYIVIVKRRTYLSSV